ncbi:FAEL158Wp [Eremothecium gossypii FDAG1]|nr:FAEL158Wp [Eremothecium gossypii FDAG1]
MGLFNGDNNDDEVKKFNADALDSRLSRQLSQLDGVVSELWRDAVLEPSSFVDNVVSHAMGKLPSDRLVDDLWLNATDALGGLLTGVGLPGGLGHPFKVREMLDERHGEKGLYSYKMPTDSQFMKCQEVRGLSVWDTRGWWRCLFPKAVVEKSLPAGQEAGVLTREQVEQDREHRHGLFFPEYTGYLSWRSHMLSLARQRREQEEKNRAARERKALPAVGTNAPEDVMSWTQQVAERTPASAANVVGTSKYTTYSYTDRGHEHITESKTYYDDGTVAINSEKKITPVDGSEPVYETINQVVNRDDESSKDGWFWRK